MLTAVLRKFVRGELTLTYELYSGSPFKSDSSREDLRAIMHHLWHFDNNDIFPHVRLKVQFALITQLIAYTTSRPGAIVESSKYQNSGEVLTYQVRLRALAEARKI